MAASDIAVTTNDRWFIALPLPAATAAQLSEALPHFSQLIETTVLPETWHLTMYFLGEVLHAEQYLARLRKPLPQTYVPTVAVTSVGRGLQRDQLWAYAHLSPILQNLRSQLLERLRSMRMPVPQKELTDFVPHVHLANLFELSRKIGTADWPVNTTFTVKELHLYRSRAQGKGRLHTIEATMSLDG